MWLIASMITFSKVVTHTTMNSEHSISTRHKQPPRRGGHHCLAYSTDGQIKAWHGAHPGTWLSHSLSSGSFTLVKDCGSQRGRGHRRTRPTGAVLIGAHRDRSDKLHPHPSSFTPLQALTLGLGTSESSVNSWTHVGSPPPHTPGLPRMWTQLKFNVPFL